MRRASFDGLPRFFRKPLPAYRNSMPTELEPLTRCDSSKMTAHQQREAPPSLGELANRTFLPDSTTAFPMFKSRHRPKQPKTRGKGSPPLKNYTSSADGTVISDGSTYSRDSAVPGEGHLPPVAPDGGFGWYIVMASFVANLLIDGMCYTSGLFLSEFNDIFNEPHWKTAIIMSLLTGYGFTGPIVASLANKYGCRSVTMCGSVLAFTAFMLGSFSPNINMLIFTFGLMGGIGLGMMYLPSIVIVGFYFNKKRSLATGMSVCGSSVGGFIFPILYTFLVNRYQWIVTLRILSVVMLLGCASGYTYRPLKPRVIKNKRIAPIPQLPKIMMNKSVAKTYNKSKLWVIDEDKELITNYSMTLKSHAFDEPGSARSLSMPMFNHRIGCGVHQPLTSKSLGACVSAGAIMISDRLPESRILRENKQRDLTRPIYRKDIFFKFTHAPTKFILTLTNLPEPVPHERKWYRTILDTLKRLVDLNLLSDTVFRVYCATSFFCLLGLFTPFIYLPMSMKQTGFNKNDIATIISIIGITNAVSRVMVGYLSSFSGINCILVSGTAQTIAGISTFCIPFMSSYTLLCVYAVVFGGSIAAWVALQSIVIVELKGIDLLTNAFGLNCMFKGFACFIGPPLAGWLSEITNSIDAVFYMAGSAMTFGGLLTFTLKQYAFRTSIPDMNVSVTDTQYKRCKSEPDISKHRIQCS